MVKALSYSDKNKALYIEEGKVGKEQLSWMNYDVIYPSAEDSRQREKTDI